MVSRLGSAVDGSMDADGSTYSMGVWQVTRQAGGVYGFSRLGQTLVKIMNGSTSLRPSSSLSFATIGNSANSWRVA